MSSENCECPDDPVPVRHWGRNNLSMSVLVRPNSKVTHSLREKHDIDVHFRACSLLRSRLEM